MHKSNKVRHGLFHPLHSKPYLQKTVTTADEPGGVDALDVAVTAHAIEYETPHMAVSVQPIG